MSLMVVSAAGSLVLVAITYAAAKGRHGAVGASCLTAVTTVICLLLGSPGLLLHSLSSFLLALGCAACRFGPKTVLATSIAAMLISYGIGLSMSVSELHELAELRAVYPLESIADRLAYEEQKVSTESAVPVLGSHVEQRLDYFEHHHGFSFRTHLLESLHNRTQDRFIMARGFGPVRMVWARRERLELPDAPPVVLPAPHEAEPYDHPRDPVRVPLAMPQRDQPRPGISTLLAMHDRGLQDFFNSDRMGYIPDRQHVAGFEPHRFQAVPQVADRFPKNYPWQVVKLELVSLLKHETPLAYVAEHLPQMDKLKDAPTRPLNPFERSSLERLRSDEDLVIEESSQGIRMFGSLRAARNCLECHGVQRGELLGLFPMSSFPSSPLPFQRMTISKRFPRPDE